MLLAVFGALALAVVAGTELVDAVLEAFVFEQGNGERILGLAVFAIAILFLLVLRALTEGARMNQQLSALLEGLAWEEFRNAKLPERFRDRIAVVIPAYNEADNVAEVIRLIPPEVCGIPTATLVVDDGSRDGTSDEAARAGSVVARHVINRGGGAALRTGYRLMSESGPGSSSPSTRTASTSRPRWSAWSSRSSTARWTWPTAPGVLGEAEPNARARSWASSSSTRWSRSHPDEGLRLLERLPRRPHHRPPPARPAPGAVPHLRVHDRGDQRGIPAKEVPVTVQKRLSGHSKKPAVVRYGLGFTNAIVRTWLR